MQAGQQTIQKLWGEVALARMKAQLEPARKDLQTAAEAIKANNAAEARYAEAKTASIIVAKLLERYAPLADTAALKAYIKEVEQTLVGVQVSLAQREIKAALATLERAAKGKDDAAIDAAIKTVQEALKTHASLTGKDRDYRSFARETSRTLSTTKKRVAEARQAEAIKVARERLTQARAKLARALKQIRRRRPLDEAFTEAEVALGELKEVVKKSRKLARKDARLAKYVQLTRPWTREARRSISDRRREVKFERQREAVGDPLKKLQRRVQRLTGPKSLEQAETLAKAVETALEQGKKLPRDREYARFVRDTQKVLKIARARMQTRQDELDMRAQQGRARQAMVDLSAAIAGLANASALGPMFDAADKALLNAQKIMQEGLPLEKRLRKYASWASDAKRKLAKDAAQIEARKLQVAVDGQTAKLDAQLAKLKGLTEAALQPGAQTQAVSAGTAQVKVVQTQLQQGAPLEDRHRAYAKHAQAARGGLRALVDQLDNAEHLITFRAGPLVELREGEVALAAADKKKGLKPRQKGFEGAVGRFKACRLKAVNILGDHPRIAGLTVQLEGRAVETKEVIGLCGARAEVAQKKLGAVSAVLAFYEGPAEYYTKGQSLLKQREDTDKQRQALKNFERCLSSGKILAHKHPELKKKDFDVNGQKIKLDALITACQKYARSLREALAKK